MFQFRRFPSCTYEFSTRYTSFTCVDCSIRKSMDRCPLTAPHGLSQLVASFFGSQCQGIPLALFVAWPCVLLGSQKLVSYRDLLFEIVDFAFKILVFKYFRISSLYLLSLYSVFNVHLSLTIVKLWWRWTESNRWPPACKAGALPAELHPHILFRILGIFSCARPYSPEVPFYRALKIKQRLQEANFVTDLGC